MLESDLKRIKSLMANGVWLRKAIGYKRNKAIIPQGN